MEAEMDRDEESEKWRKVKERERWITVMREWADIRWAFAAADWLKPSLKYNHSFFFKNIYFWSLFILLVVIRGNLLTQPPQKILLCFLNTIYLKAALMKSPI